MTLFELTLHSETSQAINQIFQFFINTSQIYKRFYIAFLFEQNQLLFFGENITFCCENPFNGQQIFQQNANCLYELSTLNLQKLNFILISSEIFPLKLIGSNNFLQFKRQIRSKNNKTMFYSHLSVDFPCIASSIDMTLDKIYQKIFLVLKIPISTQIGSFYDLQSHPSFVSNQKFFIFPTRISTANSLLKAFQAPEEVDFSIQISDFISTQEMKGKINQKTNSVTKFIHPTAIGAVRQIWCIFQKKNIFYFNQCQISCQKVLISYEKKLQTDQFQHYKTYFSNCQFASLSLNLGRNVLLNELVQLLGTDVLSLTFSPEMSNFEAQIRNQPQTQFISLIGDVFFQRKIGNSNCIMCLEGVRGELVVDGAMAFTQNLAVAGQEDLSMGDVQMVTQEIIKSPQQNQASCMQISPGQQQISPIKNVNFSAYSSQNEKFSLKFSAGQDFQFPVLLDSNVQNVEIQLNKTGDLAESGQGQGEVEQDVLSLINDDELD